MALLLALGTLWSLGFSIARYCTTHGISPLGYAFWQSLGPAILLTLLCRALRVPLFNVRTKNIFIFYLLSSLIGIAIPNANMYFAAQQLPSGILAVIINISPILTYLLALAFKEESFQPRRLLGVLCAVAGIVLIARPSGEITAAMVPWLLSALLTPISFAICAVFVAKYRPQGSSSLGLAAGMLWGSTFWLAPMVFLGGHFYALHLTITHVQALLMLEILFSSIGYWLFFQLLKNAGAVYYSLVGGVVAIAGLLWGKLFFSEQLNAVQFFCVLLIIIGIFLVNWRKKA